jgi:hypothetical protein
MKSVLLCASALAVVKRDDPILLNAEKFIVCHPSQITNPTTTAEVQSIIKGAYQKGVSVKAYGAGHSTNYILCPTDGGIALKMEGMNSIVSHDTKLMQVTVQGGAALVDFFNEMIPLGMTILGMVDYGAITVAGAIATGAHSSSLKHQSGVADSIIAVKFVNGLGDLVTLTKSNTDFLAIHTNLGALGVLVEVTFQAIPIQKVRGEQINLSDRLNTLADDIVGLVKQHDYANLYWFTENNNAILHTYNFVDVNTPGNGIRGTWDPAISSVIPLVYYKAIDILNDQLSENEMCLLAKTRALTLINPETNEDVGHLGRMYMGSICEGNKCLFPQVDDVEIAIPIANLPAAMKDIKAITTAIKVCFPVFGVYIRFGKQSDTLLGPTRNGDVAYVELHILRSRNGTPHLGFAAVDEIRQLLLIKYKGQPHYGKNFAVDFIGKANPKFTAIAQKYDPKGLFQNNFLKSLSTTTASTANAKYCALERKCFCSSDAHCPDNWNCVNGSVFTEAKVCRKGRNFGCIRDDECASGKCGFFNRCF